MLQQCQRSLEGVEQSSLASNTVAVWVSYLAYLRRGLNLQDKGGEENVEMMTKDEDNNPKERQQRPEEEKQEDEREHQMAQFRNACQKAIKKLRRGQHFYVYPLQFIYS